jgi:hypothetical protein
MGPFGLKPNPYSTLEKLLYIGMRPANLYLYQLCENCASYARYITAHAVVLCNGKLLHLWKKKHVVPVF